MIKQAIYKTKIGYIHLKYEDDFLLYLDVKESIEENLDCEYTEFSDKVYRQVCEYLDGERKTFDINLKLNCTNFIEKVLQEVIKIDYAQVKTYKYIAEKFGGKNYSRAVGNAINKNPILIIIPCHRIIGSNNKLVGFRAGLELKKYLLELEKKNSLI